MGRHWTRMLERVDLEPRSLRCRRRGSVQSDYCHVASDRGAARPRQEHRAGLQRRRRFGAELRDECLRLGIFYDLKRGSGRNRRLARSLQPRAAPLIFRLSATRTYDTGGHRTATTHIPRHAVNSQIAWFKIPVRSRPRPSALNSPDETQLNHLKP